jgi:hypothetical protein
MKKIAVQMNFLAIFITSVSVAALGAHITFASGYFLISLITTAISMVI